VRVVVTLVIALVVGCMAFMAAPLHAATTYWTTPALLKHFFKDSERVRAVEVLGSELAAALEGQNVGAPKGKYLVYVGQTGERIDGFAVVDDEKGQHMPITFGFLLGADGRLKDAQVMTYREPYGHEIRDRRFLDQLVGKSLTDGLKPGVDVDGVTGATISVKSTTIAARRALALCDIARRKVVSLGQN
jgi:Na+-translocating ferredoxin:NAD+ oxidoreductase subunit G